MICRGLPLLHLRSEQGRCVSPVSSEVQVQIHSACCAHPKDHCGRVFWAVWWLQGTVACRHVCPREKPVTSLRSSVGRKGRPCLISQLELAFRGLRVLLPDMAARVLVQRPWYVCKFHTRALGNVFFAQPLASKGSQWWDAAIICLQTF